MMLPTPVLIAIPLPSCILLLLLTITYLLPLLPLYSPSRLLPHFQAIAKIMPSPRRQNLPRSFFGLPTRSPDSDAVRDIGIRSKVMILMIPLSALQLSCGWAYLVDGKKGLLGIGTTTLPSGLLSLAVFSIFAKRRPVGTRTDTDTDADSEWRWKVFRGGVNHQTIFKRILPISLIPPLLVTVLMAAIPAHAGLIGSTTSSILVGGILVLGGIGGWREYASPTRRGIRLRSTSASSFASTDKEKNKEEGNVPGSEEVQDAQSWITSPSQVSSTYHSAFSYSPTTTTSTPVKPASKTPPSTRAQARAQDASDSSWLSEPTTTPSTIPSWEYSSPPSQAHGSTQTSNSPQALASPEPVITRPRSRSPSPNGLPRPIEPTPPRQYGLPKPTAPTPSRALPPGKTSVATAYTYTTTGTPGSHLRSPGGSILADYSPDPARPLPRGFESLTSFPLSPENGAGISRSSLSGITFIPEPARGSTWTLGTGSGSGSGSAADYQTPKRAPPPPPIPDGMPLPPTPTVARHETSFDWPIAAGVSADKGSSEMLMGEREWYFVDSTVESIETWDNSGRGVGLVAVLGVVVCYALTMPLLVKGPGTLELSLYLISLILPSPLLALASYLLRYTPAPLRRKKASSTTTASTYRSLALTSESQLSVPATVSPKLTPPAPNRTSAQDAPVRLGKLLEPKPNISNFGHPQTPARRHTVYGVPETYDLEAEEAARRTLARRSGDVWIESGHARFSGGVWSRVGEMIKPVPAMRVLETEHPLEGSRLLRRLRGGVVSMLLGRDGQYAGAQEEAEIGMQTIAVPHDDTMPSSPITINIESPSKHEARARDRSSVLSTSDMGHVEDEEGEIQVAQIGRMSASPPMVYRASGNGYELDWLTAGVLPGLVPGIRIGPEIRVSGSYQPFDVPDSPPSPRGRSHGTSTSVDFSGSPNFSNAMTSTPQASIRNRLKHKKSMSLPAIDSSDFADVRRSIEESGRDLMTGHDLPLIPSSLTAAHGLSPVHEEENETTESSKMRRTLREMTPAILHLTVSDSTLRSTASSRLALSDLGPHVHLREGIRIRLDSSISSWTARSVGSTDEEAVDEMERVLHMDTPTRAEFVISPTTTVSEFGRSASRASARTTLTESDMPPLPSIDGVWNNVARTATTGAEDDDGRYTDAEESQLQSQSPHTWVFPRPTPTTTATSHPHPPPLLQHVQSVPNFSRPRSEYPAPPVIGIGPHPPVQVQGLRNRQTSIDTMHSTITTTTTTCSDDTTASSPPPPSHAVPEFKPSRQELMLVKHLKERAAEIKKAPSSSMDDRRTSSAGGLKPLRLVMDKQANRPSIQNQKHNQDQTKPLPLSSPKQKNGKVQVENQRTHKHTLPKPPRMFGTDKTTPLSGKGSKTSAKSDKDKENVDVPAPYTKGKSSKASSGSGAGAGVGVGGISGLRV